MRIDLFHLWECPHSARVRQAIEERALAGEIRYCELDEDPNFRAKLVSLTGKLQVPCLVVNGKPMLESEAIVRWLKQGFLKRRHAPGRWAPGQAA